MTEKKPARKRSPRTPPSRAGAVGHQTSDSRPGGALPGVFPIVGIGASAGGLAAFEAFFSGMAPAGEPRLAFVLVQHLVPDHKSLLAGLIRRHTRMRVFDAAEGMTVQVNCAYIIPPGRHMALLNGTLQLLEPPVPRGQRQPLDFFFRSLAQDQGERAIGIVLSGTGSDGTQGVRAIKAGGGMVMAQRPESTEHDGIPRHAPATGPVDYELPPAEMAAQLIAYVARSFGTGGRPVAAPAPRTEQVLRKIVVLLRAQAGHDFSQYKPSTIYRRIERRMVVLQVEAIEDYLKYLQQTPAEVEALFRDLLIGVTNFFRDPEAFKVLETEGIPRLFAGKAAGAVIRVWVPGCSSGEEAYSIAILLQERLEALKQSYTLQVFATDIDSQAIAVARTGLYPASIAADLSRERLARFFTAEPDGRAYRIVKGIRDLLVFSEQSVIKDPPFSKLDLISCRNLLIYLGGDLQRKLIPLFHYALNPGGTLLLGTSETVGEFGDLFSVLDRKAKLFERKADFGGTRRTAARLLPEMKVLAAALPPAAGKAAGPTRPPLRELTEQALLRQIDTAGALVNAQGDILYLHGRAGVFLELVPGEVGTTNILKMARDGLRRELAIALHRAAGTRELVRVPGLRVRINGPRLSVNLSVGPVAAGAAAVSEAPLYLVLLEEVASAAVGTGPEAAGPEPAGAVDARIAALRQELRTKELCLQAANEELETANEELKSSNEEMQSVNEELQSTNEELETSKEELQAANEELATVNTELQAKVLDLSRANNDMNNLLAGTGVGTVFVDHRLHILRFTPAATRIMNLIVGDVGRPVGHLASNLVGYTRLVEDVQAVLDTLVAREEEVQSVEGKWYTLRIQPYRTLANVIEGAVITFIESTRMRQCQEALRRANALLRLAVVVRDAPEAITVQDIEGRILAWNPGAVRLYGWSESEALTMNARDRIPPELRKQEQARGQQLRQTGRLEPYRTVRITKAGTRLTVAVDATALVNETGQCYALATIEQVSEASHTDQT